MRLIQSVRSYKHIVLLTSLLGLFAFSCKKDHNVLGVDVQPAADALNASTESGEVFAYTQGYDSVISLNNRYKYLGSNQDPVFGRTDVGLYVVPNIPDGLTYLNFGDDARLSSAEIMLAINGIGLNYAGTNSSAVSYSVFALANELDPARVYYTNSPDLYLKNSLIGSYTGSLVTYEGKLVLRIPLDPNYAALMLNEPQYLYNNVIFQSTYKGYYIKCATSTGEGLITEFDLEDALSGLWLRYKNGEPSATKTEKSFRFTFSGSNINPIRFNTVRYDPANGGNALLTQQLVSKDSTAGGDALFLKGLGGAKAKVYLPILQKRSDSVNIAVNRAELVFYLDPAYYSPTNYPWPLRLSLIAADSTGREIFVRDQLNVTDRARYDGKYDETNKRYVFNLARHAQAVFQGKIKNYGFYLVVSDASSLATYANLYNSTNKELLFLRRDEYVQRVVLAGRNHPQLKPTFNLSLVRLHND